MDLDTPTKQPVVVFGGDPETAARRCDKVLGLCRQGKQWRELWALTPAKQQCRLYVQPDKSPKQIRLEIATRRIHKVLADNYWRTDFVPNKYRGQ
eukprot:11320271-Karenia_brevis.AAC.1